MAKFLSRRSYRVGKSATGLGLFANVPIAKGTRIIRYWGPKLTSQQADARDNKYMFEINSRWTIDGSIRRNTARYVNHACRPNAESDIIGHLVLIRAIKNIAPGEEITYDYGKDYFNTYIKPIGCKCASCVAKRKRERAEAREKARRAKMRAARKAEKSKQQAGGIDGVAKGRGTKKVVPAGTKKQPRRKAARTGKTRPPAKAGAAAKSRPVKKKTARVLPRAA
jgi:hypothetical protein